MTHTHTKYNLQWRKKPVIIKAVRLLPSNDVAMLQFMEETSCPFEVIGEPPVTEGLPYMVIHTLEGDMTANVGDWLIQGVKGEFYPCKHDIFVALYDPI